MHSFDETSSVIMPGVHVSCAEMKATLTSHKILSIFSFLSGFAFNAGYNYYPDLQNTSFNDVTTIQPILFFIILDNALITLMYTPCLYDICVALMRPHLE